MERICIVTTRHISYNPRVLKEADALHSKGYEVTVISINNNAAQRRFDEMLMKSRTWKLKTVDFQKGAKSQYKNWLWLSIVQRVNILLSKFTFSFGIAERAAEKAYGGLISLALKTKADLFIAHHAEALAVAFSAAKHNHAKFGFDAEDFHTGMADSTLVTHSDKIIEYLEGKYLPRCNYMTAASKGIGEAYVRKYGLDQPLVILNVFPCENLPVVPVHDPVRFYWYSQVIGPNRGIETLLDAAGKIGMNFEIHIRGSFHNREFEEQLAVLSQKNNISDKVFFHEPILAEQIIQDANKYDVGLALESGISVNRNLAVANKIFAYLMARLFIIGTDTVGQKDIFTNFPDASAICKMYDADDLAGIMKDVILHRDRLLNGKQAADRAVKDHFNWQLESEKLYDCIKKAFRKNDRELV